MLSPYRVLDLTDHRAELGPMLLADLGADVIKVEPPGGAPSRREGPFEAAEAIAPESLRFHAYNRNKRSVVLDIDAGADRHRFLELVRGADFLIENAGPGVMEKRGLGWEQLRTVNPALVYVAISPFGQDGPYAAHLASDLTLAAMGGMVALNGDADRPPVRVTVPQAWHHAAAESAVAALVAHFLRLRNGAGRFVDVSVQAAVFWTGLNAMIASSIQGRDVERAGTLLQLGVIDLPLVYDATDGEVVLVPSGGTMLGVIDRLIEEGIVPGEWGEREDWASYDTRYLLRQPLTYTPEEVCDALRRFTAMHAKRELFEWGLAHGLTIAPVSTVADVLAFRQLESRSYWWTLPLPSGRTVRAPGAAVRLSKTPITLRRPAPAAGQHTAEVLGERRSSAPQFGSSGEPSLPFSGLKVADFSWIAVGPITAKYLGDHGATVVRVEGLSPLDRLRAAGPHRGGIPGTDRSQFFGSFNTSKKDIVLDLKQPGGKAIAERLLDWCDVAIEAFVPGTMERLGLGYEQVRERNPGMIMVSTCLLGRGGPAAQLAGYGYHAAAISGFYEVTGWPDRHPGGPFSAYTDVIAPHFLAAAVMAALDHRRRTGEGQHIDQAQMESALQFLAPELLDFQANGVIARRAGNDSPGCAPHNVYPCLGDDQWIAIAVEAEPQWLALRALLGEPPWSQDPALQTGAGRFERRALIDSWLGDWTAGQERYTLMQALQAAGVPAGVVQRSSDLIGDSQLAHRHFFRPMQHGEMGEVPYEGHMFRIAGYDNGPRFPSPCLGQDTVEVLTEILGLDDAELAEALGGGGVGL